MAGWLPECARVLRRHPYIPAMPPERTRRLDVTRTYLELRGVHELRPGRAPAHPPRLERRRPIAAAEYRALYTLVGERWSWRDRLALPEAALDAHLASPRVEVWIATVSDEAAGYFELVQRDDDAVEIMYFGLAPRFIGRGFGAWLLTRACEAGFAMGARRIVLNTCSLDAPAALPNYLARGFTIVRDEVYQVEIPDA